MIIMFENGRLGNQLFQYCVLRKFGADKHLFLLGMKSLKSTFVGINCAGETRWGKLVERGLIRLGPRWLDALSRKFGVIGWISEDRTDKSTKIQVQKGLVSSVYYATESYWQCEGLVEDSVAEGIQLRPEIQTQASNVMMRLSCDKRKIFFVHVRRGDYASWPTKEAPGILPLKWYLKQMDVIRARFDAPVFVVVSDDRYYAEEMFGSYSDVHVCHENEKVDFATMSMCYGGGILSASSFAWWAAYFSRQVNKDAFFIAPMYWGGHRLKSWYPNEAIKTSWITYASVEE